MKKRVFFTLLSVCLLGYSGQADAQSKAECFKMQSARVVKEIRVEKTFPAERGTTELEIFDGVDAAYGLSVTMDINRLADNFLVRVLLIDKEGHKHLVAESYREIAPEGKDLRLTDYCEETALLGGVDPVSLQVIADNAEVTLHSLSIATEGSREQTPRSEEFRKQTASLRRQQVEEKVSKINIYNKAHKKLWVAGPTSVSLMSYEDKTKMMNATAETNFGGFEYYAGGIFEIGNAAEARKEQLPSRQASSPTALTSVNTAIPLTSFDWRNRHGKNWMTGVRDQGQTLYCVAFAIAGCVEAMRNLYYNIPDTTHLSVQQLACCSSINPTSSIQTGVSPYAALTYFIQTGIMKEADYPFDAAALQECHSDEISPSDITKITGYSSISTTSNETIRRKLIEKGPLLALINTGNNLFGHAMVLTGYKIIESGMEVVEFLNNEMPNLYPWPLDDDYPLDTLINHTCWIMKNSWGLGYGQNGYMYAFIHDNSMLDLFSITCPITTLHLSGSDRGYSDNDGDGFYFWGGEESDRPASMPQWVPTYKDADDTNPNVGRLLDSNLEMEDIVPDHSTTFLLSGNFDALGAFHFQYVHHHYSLQSGAVLQIDRRVNFYNGSTLTLCNGSTLLVKEGGFLNNVILNIESGSTIKIEGGGQIKMAQGHSFNPPVGTIVEIENGSIEQFSD